MMENPQAAAQANKNGPRMDYLVPTDYFMAVARLTALNSRDPKTQVGACIVNQEDKIVAVGYNGMPTRCGEDQLPWARSAERRLDNKYLYVCPAELNAIMNKNSADLKGCIMYVTRFPCNECAKLIIQSGIIKVFYLSDNRHDDDETVASRLMLDLARIPYSPFQSVQNNIVLDLTYDA